MTDYFIDPTYGDDSGTGLTEADPWRTFDNVNSGPFSSGDKIRLKKGETWRDELIMPSSGDEDDQITVTSYGTGDDPIISGSDRVTGFRIGTNLLPNPSFEDWTSTTIDDWTITETSGSDVTEETADIHHGSSSVSIEYDTGKHSAFISTTSPLSLTDSKKYRFTIWHKDPVIDGAADVSFLSAMIYRTGGAGDDEYLAPTTGGLPQEGDGGYWTSGTTSGMPIGLSPWWAPWQIDFDTGENDDGHTDYYVKILAYILSPFNNYALKTFLFDSVSLVLLPTEAFELVEDGGFENWTSGALDSWTETIGEAGSDATQNTTSEYSGASAVDVYVEDAGSGYQSILLSQELAVSLADNTDYEVSLTHKIDTISGVMEARPAVVIWRNDGAPPGEYLQPDGVTWDHRQVSQNDHCGVPLEMATAGDTYQTDTFTFNTGTPYDAAYTSYWIGVGPFQYANGAIKFDTAGRTFTFDEFSLKKVEVSEGNKVTNWSFEDWTSGSPDSWTVVQNGDTTFAESDEHRQGAACCKFTADSDDSDVGVKQTGISLDGSTTYRFGCFARTLESTNAYELEVAIQIIRESDGYYWDGAAWATGEEDAVSYHPRDWELVADEFTTDSATDTYTMYIHRSEGTRTKRKEEMWFDVAFIQEKAIADEVWEIEFKEKPGHVWATGTIAGETCDHMILEDETQTSKQTGLFQPHFMGWSYDREDQILYINIGEDPGEITFECSMRDTCVSIDDEAYVTIDGLQLLRPKKNSASMGYKTTPRSTEVQVKNCKCWYTGEAAILAGHLPELPYEGGIYPVETTTLFTPSEIVIEGNDVYRYGDGAPYFIRCAQDEILEDPDFEEWDSAAELTYWDDTIVTDSTFEREEDDVWRGNYCCKITTDPADGDCVVVSQEDLTGIFESSDDETARVSLWYKTPDWNGNPVNGVFMISVIRYDSSGAATGPILKHDGTWLPLGQGGEQYGIGLTQSLTWTQFELEIPRPDDFADYPIYSVFITVHPLFKTVTKGESLLFDQASLSHGWAQWSVGGSYGPPTTGIMISQGAGLKGGCGNVTINKNKVDGNQAMINYSSGKNGIVLRNGGGTVSGSLALVAENEVTRASHAIVAIGDHSDQDRFVTNLHIRHNYVHDTGDDGIWIDGLVSSKICYNVVSTTGDNCIDVWNSAGIEVYNNSFNNNENEMVTVTGHYVQGFLDTFIFLYNNVFYNWGSDWIDSDPGKRRGCAVGFYLTTGQNGGIGYSEIDYNLYYSEDDLTLTDHPFHVAEVEKTAAEWAAYGFDANGLTDDPEYASPSDDSLAIPRSSPCVAAGVDLSNLDVVVQVPGFPLPFDKNGAIDYGLMYISDWPSDVVTTDQGTEWEIGAYNIPVPMIIDDSASFPTDKSLIGVTAYVVDSTNHRIWKGIIISNAATILYLDEWEAVFNADGYYPGPSGTYYVGYIYLYDKTPVLAFENVHWEKGLTEHELLTNNISPSTPIYFRRSLNHGDIVDTEANTLSGDRMKRKVLSGLHRNFQHEHALLTNQEIRVKSSIYHIVWKRGRMDQ